MESKSECYCTEYTLVSSDLKLLPCLMLVTQTPSQSTASMTQGDSQKWPSKANSYGHTKNTRNWLSLYRGVKMKRNDTNAREYSIRCQLTFYSLIKRIHIPYRLRDGLKNMTYSFSNIHSCRQKKSTKKVELTTNTDDMVHQFRKGG